MTENLRVLRDLGIALALDDFLIHYSSLDTLAWVPAHIVKLDRRFVAPLNRGQPSPVAEAIAALARSLHLLVIAEGVETEDGEAAVASLGCELAQGFLYSPAVDAGQTGRLLDAFGRASSPRAPHLG